MREVRAGSFGEAVHAYVRAVGGAMSEVVRSGPFTVLVSRINRDAPWNYSIPDDGAAPSAAEVDELLQVFLSRGLQPHVEVVPAAAPAVGPALLAAGLRLDEELPLMGCDEESWVPVAPPDGITVRTPASVDELRAMAVMQHEVFGDATPVSDAFLRQRRELSETGGILLAAFEAGGAVAGAGMCPPQHEAMREIVGVATVPQQRRRGIASAVTSALARLAFDSGCSRVYLEAASGADGAYRRAGFHNLGSVAHYVH